MTNETAHNLCIDFFFSPLDHSKCDAQSSAKKWMKENNSTLIHFIIYMCIIQ